MEIRFAVAALCLCLTIWCNVASGENDVNQVPGIYIDDVPSQGKDACDDSALPRIAFLVLVHDDDTLQGCERLIDALYHEDHLFYVHFDTKMQPHSYDYEWRRISHGRTENMFHFSHFDIKWASWTMLSPWFSAVKLALKSPKPWDIFINLSGDAYPVLTPDGLRRALLPVREMNFMTGSTSITGLRPTAWSEFDPTWHKRKAFPNPIIEGFSFEPYYGSQWMVVSREFVEMIESGMGDKKSFTYKLADWFMHGTVEIDTGFENRRIRPHIPDEIFFPTVFMASRLNHTVPPPRLESMGATHFIRMDEHYPWTKGESRYEAPPDKKSARSWGPYYLGTYDLGDIKASKALFVRKVSERVDQNLFHILPVQSHDDILDIKWPSRDKPSLNISPRQAQFSKMQLDKDGCLRVAESRHCPPVHLVDPSLVERYDLKIFGG